ncbi:EVE domain-containing protein [Pseudoflavitalea sp. G-6-1-2]|uniref:AAA family ATPase n=1 Tax=Pseudoflavitalea sp. G-6-1-2 TaxID=2728841 RepID=UPI00146AECF7|nr:AAA family ATPase [Pseudoflavitalea sp. G-6-1-2]NML23515.1 EVE domain-containing protein [Pseudoflavitalea sp. G-6-1-2]
MSIDKITKQHVLDAVDKIEREGIELKRSRDYDVVIDGKAYPPKEIMRYANLLANGTKDWLYSGGEPTNKYLRKFEFEIVPKGEEPEIPATKEGFVQILGTIVNLTGNVCKLGCNWGKGAPSFYEFIKKHSMVIGVNDRMYSIGDLVIITEGQTVLSIGKVLEAPSPSVNFPEYEADFDNHKIEYDSNVNISKVEWYELSEDEVFTYPLQQGICRVHAPYKNIVLGIWHDRFINYWVFQCNPAEFDYAKAVKSNLLHDWTVAAHKDKIKTNDKVILWLTGKRAGCYALARITNDPAETGISPDNHLWKSEPKISLKAGIELTHNLVDNPLLWQNIKSTKGLEELKVGNQGTNFSATRKQYHTLLKLIEANTQNMGKKLDLYINTILYGPPGTGKTYKLNQYEETYFTDRGVTNSAEDVLKGKVNAYPFWKVLGAVLGSRSASMSVSEILESPLIKAKINPDAKTPRNTVWRILQSYADSASTDMDVKYKGPIQLFKKSNDSKWSILEDKKADLADIIDQELLDIAANPVQQPVQSSTFKTRYNFITFHQKYSYEDFIEGIKPLLSSEDAEEQSGELQFELKKGIFYNSCLEALRLVGYDSFEACYQDSVENRIAKFETAKSNPSMQFALFIDEINRANISAVFGELITLLEDDKRIGADNEMWLELPYSNEKFSVPGNLYVIGTMNTADRSIALLDIALRRRFEFKSLYPEYIESEWWASLLEALNQAIYNWKKNPDFFIGHAFFINKPEADRARILNTKIIPLLYEYCQSNAATVKNILSEAGVALKSTGIKENFQIIAE